MTNTTSRHSLDTVRGYTVELTVSDGLYLAEHQLIRRFDGAGSYPEALELALVYRDLPNTYAVIKFVYDDGEISQAL